MKTRSRILNGLDLVFNLATLGLIVYGLMLAIDKPVIEPFTANTLRYYTFLAVFVTGAADILMIWSNLVSFIKGRDCTPRFFYSARFVSAVMCIATIFLMAFVIRPYYFEHTGQESVFTMEGGLLLINFVIPLLSVVQFLGFEIEPKARFKKTIEPFVITTVYLVTLAITSAVFSILNGAKETANNFVPYFFFCLTPDLAANYYMGTPLWLNYITFFGVMIGSYVLSVIVWGLNRISSNIFVGVEYVVVTEEAKKEVKEEDIKPITRKERIKKYLSTKLSFTGSNGATQLDHIYHISYHDRKAKTWKVKSEGAGRALKVFPTQKAAIDFANQQVKLHGGSIRVHSMMGKMRKE